MYTPARESVWKGFNDSSIMVHRSDSYNQLMGKVDEKIEAYLSRYQDSLNVGMVLWGVGNHGGGPSRIDLNKIEELRKKYPELNILHSTPEEYFAELAKEKDTLYVWDKDMNPTMPGCYTSQVHIKQTHRRLENELYLTEKMCAHAELTAGMTYPREQLEEAQSKLLFAEFHDILPGSSIQKVEEQGLEIMHHGLDILRTLKTQAFFTLCREQKKAAEGTYPVFVYNPHPFPVTDVFEAEFMLADQNYDTTQFDFTQVYCGQEKVPSQCVKERSNVPIQWRKRVAFHAAIQPFSVTRFDVKVEKREFPVLPEVNKEDICLSNAVMSIRINRETGLIDSYKVGGVEYAKQGFGFLEVFKDNEDSWGMADNIYSGRPLGSFALVKDAKRAALIAAASADEMEPVRIIESGDVLVKVEAIFEYENSAAIVQYTVNKFDSAVKVDIRIINSLKNRIIKWMLPMGFAAVSYFPDGKGKESCPLLTIDNPYVSISALKKAADGESYILRLFNGSEKSEAYQLKSQVLKLDFNDSLKPYEIRTLRVSSEICVKTELIDLI